MKTFFGTYRIRWQNIGTITRLLNSGGFHPNIESPPQPTDVRAFVEIPVKVKAQGRDHVSIARATIIGNPNQPRAEEITGFTELPSSKWTVFWEFIAERGWETFVLLIGGLGAVFGAFYMLAYYFPETHMKLEWYHYIELTILGAVPAVIDLGYAGAWRKKNAFSIDSNNQPNGTTQTNGATQTNSGTNHARVTNMLGTPND